MVASRAATGPRQERRHVPFACSPSSGTSPCRSTTDCSTHGCIGQLLLTQQCGAAATAAVHDAQAAVRWLRANATTYGIDPDRIGIAGESAGGITAAGVGIRANEPGDSGSAGYDSSVQAWISISGGVRGGRRVDSTDAPGCLFSGTIDPYIPYQWSVDANAAMKAARVPVLFETLRGSRARSVGAVRRPVRERIEGILVPTSRPRRGGALTASACRR